MRASELWGSSRIITTRLWKKGKLTTKMIITDNFFCNRVLWWKKNHLLNSFPFGRAQRQSGYCVRYAAAHLFASHRCVMLHRCQFATSCNAQSPETSLYRHFLRAADAPDAHSQNWSDFCKCERSTIIFRMIEYIDADTCKCPTSLFLSLFLSAAAAAKLFAKFVNSDFETVVSFLSSPLLLRQANWKELKIRSRFVSLSHTNTFYQR